MARDAGAGAGGAPEDFIVALWRAVAVFRVAALGYAILTVAQNFTAYRHPVGGWPGRCR
jgi:hypothetical protein